MKRILYIVCIFLGLQPVLSQDNVMKLSLKDAINYAIKNNYANKTALNNIDIAKKVKWEAISKGLPQINGKVEYNNWLKQQVSMLPGEIAGGKSGTFIPVTFGTKQTMKVSATLTQLIFDGSYLVGVQSTKTYLQISKQAKEKTEIATREAVINAYGNVLVTEKSISILEDNKRVLKKNLYETEKIYENGLTELENVEQLKITLGTLESNLSNVKRLKKIAYQMLNISMGISIDKNVELTDNLNDLTEKNIDLNLLSQTFNINNHIDYKISYNDVKIKNILMKLEKSKALPSLSAFVNYGANSNSNDFTFFNDDQKWFQLSLLGINLNIPIFSSLGRSSRTAKARIELENANIKLEEVKQKLNLQVQTAKSEYQLSIENYEIAKNNLELAKRIEKKQQVKFFEGISSSFDLSQAQNQLYTQQNNYVQSMLNVIAKKAKLESALNLFNK